MLQLPSSSLTKQLQAQAQAQEVAASKRHCHQEDQPESPEGVSSTEQGLSPSEEACNMPTELMEESGTVMTKSTPHVVDLPAVTVVVRPEPTQCMAVTEEEPVVQQGGSVVDGQENGEQTQPASSEDSCEQSSMSGGNEEPDTDSTCCRCSIL